MAPHSFPAPHPAHHRAVGQLLWGSVKLTILCVALTGVAWAGGPETPERKKKDPRPPQTDNAEELPLVRRPETPLPDPLYLRRDSRLHVRFQLTTNRPTFTQLLEQLRQATKLELVVNVKTARALGVVVSPALVARADHLVE